MTLVDGAEVGREDMNGFLAANRPLLASVARPATEYLDDATDFVPEPIAEVRRRAARELPGAQAVILVHAAYARAMHGVGRRDALMLAEAVELLEETLEASEEGATRLHFLCLLGGIQHFLAVLKEDAALLDQSVSCLARAVRLLDGPQDPAWAQAAAALGRAYRSRGDAAGADSRYGLANLAASRRVGLQALQAFTWSVLLQSGTAHATASGAQAAGEAIAIARWCVADEAYEDAVRALDAGRGLVLHAATVSRTVPTLLDAAGHDALAAEWRRVGAVEQPIADGFSAPSTGVPSELRRRVLAALNGTPYARRLLEVPPLAEITAALDRIHADALVYLIPADEHGGDGSDSLGITHGAALIVPAKGSPHVLELSELRTVAPALTAYQAAGSPGRDAGGPIDEPTPPPAAPPPHTSRQARAALDRLCAWAGESVMAELLPALPRPLGRVPSVVLVPMGQLGLVPWHAAYTLANGKRRYATHDAQFSSIPSARLLCEVAGRETGTGTAGRADDVLIVGDPTRNLRHAGEEARAIHSVLHPRARFLDHRDGTPAEVLAWLARTAGGTLHLACHGTVDPDGPRTAWLSLARGDLAAEDLTERPGTHGGPDLVVLAACLTNVSGRGYDEAYSLATAFLVAGARSVLGSLWPVPDDATSLLMYMTHHYLKEQRQTPGQALRSAQLWMINDGRTAPPGMPADLAARVRGIDGEDLAGWAGFTHLGW